MSADSFALKILFTQMHHESGLSAVRLNLSFLLTHNLKIYAASMKKIFLILPGFFLLACTSKVSLNLQFNGEEVFSCSEAAISKLSPENGGFRFICPDNTSLYVVYDTSVAKDGTIVSVDLQGTKTQSYLPAVFSSKRGQENCASAKALNRQSGEQPLAKTFSGSPKPGSYELAMAKPCGNLTITIGPSK